MATLDATVLSPERRRAMDYLTARAAAMTAGQVRARFGAAVAEFEAAIAGVTEDEARGPAPPGEWTIAQVVDHLAQTTIRSAEELRHALAGRRPPGPPVYEALTSGAARWAPWAELAEGLRAAAAEMDALLRGAAESEPPAPATVRTILVISRSLPDGRSEPETFEAELGWKGYALVQRLHVLDHRTQVRRLRRTQEREA